MRNFKDEASCSSVVVKYSGRRPELFLDWVSAIKGLHRLRSLELSKLIKDADVNIIRYITESGLNIQIDVEKLARYLALHLLSVIVARDRDEALFKYLLHGLQLLHCLFGLAPRHPKIEQILVEDVKVSEQLLDLVLYLLMILGASHQEFQVSNDMVHLHSTLVASSLYLLTACISSQWHELAQVLLVSSKVNRFLDAAFASVYGDVRFLAFKLSAEHHDSSAKSRWKADDTINHLCHQCEASLQFLHLLFQQKLFREHLLKNKELCNKGGVLFLAQAVMNLHVSSYFEESSSILAAVSRLKSRVLSILLNLCEAENVSYLDEVANIPGSMSLAKSIALKVLELLKQTFARCLKQPSSSSDKIYPRGLLQLNAMRLADVFSDDSNFRPYVTTEVLAAVFSLPHGEFLSSWCSSDLPVWEEDATLEYGPFSAIEWVLNSSVPSDSSGPMNYESTFVPCNMPQATYAHQRTSLLVKVIANLHCFVPDICKEEKDLFLHKFLECFREDLPISENGLSSHFYADKVNPLHRNLGSLLSHAESLIPRFVNEEDVQLLRVFITQLESLITPTSENNQVILEYGDEPNILEVAENHAHEAYSTGVSSSPLIRNVGPDLNRGSANLVDGVSESSSFQEVDQLSFRLSCVAKSADEGMKNEMKDKGQSSRCPPQDLKVTEDTQNVESSGSDSSFSQGKEPIDRGDSVDFVKESGFSEIRENEKVETELFEEKQQRKRKRAVMNDEQIKIIETALKDEPNMHRSAASLQFWADKLSAHGSEVTTSRLKNWLNNRKARLARAAKEGRVSSEGDNSDKQVTSVVAPPQGSLGEPARDTNVLSTASGDPQGGVGDSTSKIFNSERPRIVFETPVSTGPSEFMQCEAGQHTVLVDKKAEDIGTGKVF